ncbi:MAG: Ig domain-containing protein [Trueperaceae bacterium]
MSLLLAGCGGELQTPGEALRIFGTSLPQAFAGERYDAPVRAVGGLRPFSYTLGEGELPPGLELQNGVIRGVPSETGRFVFTVTVSDANLSRTFQEYTLTVIERPPPTLELVVPETEVREPTTVRLRLANASEVRAVSARLIWDPGSLELAPGSVAAEASGTALLWESGPGWLQIDLAALGTPWNDARNLANFVLAPSQPTVLEITATVVFLDDRDGRHFQGAPAAPEGGADSPDTDPPGPDTPDSEDEDPAEGDPAESDTDGADSNGAESNGPDAVGSESAGSESAGSESAGSDPIGTDEPEPEPEGDEQ